MTTFARALIVGLASTVTAIVAVVAYKLQSKPPAPTVSAGARSSSLTPTASAFQRPTPACASEGEPTVNTVVKGRLVDDADAKPIAGAEIGFRWDKMYSGLNVVARSGADGSFELPRIPSGQYLRAIVKKAGYLDDVVEGGIPRGAAEHDLGSVRLIRGDWKQRIAGGPRGVVGLNHELRQGKVLITGVRPETPAAEAGLKVGERIVAVDGKSMDNMAHAARTYFLQGMAGTDVNLTIEGRDGSRRSVVLTRRSFPGLTDVPVFY